MGKIYRNDHKMYQASIKYTKGRYIDLVAKKLRKFFVARHSKIYPNWDFWFENIPSGNPEGSSTANT
jgi:hypothetical protein